LITGIFIAQLFWNWPERLSLADEQELTRSASKNAPVPPVKLWNLKRHI
jgi:hypothetical protein